MCVWGKDCNEAKKGENQIHDVEDQQENLKHPLGAIQAAYSHVICHGCQVKLGLVCNVRTASRMQGWRRQVRKASA